MQKLALLAALAFAGCSAFQIEINATSYAYLPQAASGIAVTGGLADAQQRVVELLAARGFPLVDRQATATGVWLKFAGNRDFFGTETIGSAFYAWIDPLGPRTSRVRMVGKPTINHDEGCPAMDGKPCSPLKVYTAGYVTGREEATAIHGVFSELAVDGAVPELPARTASK